ncbi:MAG: hypothetical protein IJY52_03925, partial [Anaerotignum sp.]|nr:hypothetical protein [Anaerotignum sp.]
ERPQDNCEAAVPFLLFFAKTMMFLMENGWKSPKIWINCTDNSPDFLLLPSVISANNPCKSQGYLL